MLFTTCWHVCVCTYSMFVCLRVYVCVCMCVCVCTHWFCLSDKNVFFVTISVLHYICDFNVHSFSRVWTVHLWCLSKSPEVFTVELCHNHVEWYVAENLRSHQVPDGRCDRVIWGPDVCQHETTGGRRAGGCVTPSYRAVRDPLHPPSTSSGRSCESAKSSGVQRVTIHHKWWWHEFQYLESSCEYFCAWRGCVLFTCICSVQTVSLIVYFIGTVLLLLVLSLPLISTIEQMLKRCIFTMFARFLFSHLLYVINTCECLDYFLPLYNRMIAQVPALVFFVYALA